MTLYLRRRFLPPLDFAVDHNFFDSCPISTAPSPASNPLLPPFSPARSMACSKVSQVSTQKRIGTPVSIWASCKPREVSEQT